MEDSTETRERAIYHTILGEMHRLRATLLNLQAIDAPDTAESLREYFGREKSVTTGKLAEWRQRRPELYRQASEAFSRESAESGAGNDR